MTSVTSEPTVNNSNINNTDMASLLRGDNNNNIPKTDMASLKSGDPMDVDVELPKLCENDFPLIYTKINSDGQEAGSFYKLPETKFKVYKFHHGECIQALLNLADTIKTREDKGGFGTSTQGNRTKSATAGFIILNNIYFFGFGFKVLPSTPLHVETSLILALHHALNKNYITGKITSIRVYSTLQPCCMCSLVMHQFMAKLRQRQNDDIQMLVAYKKVDTGMGLVSGIPGATNQDPQNNLFQPMLDMTKIARKDLYKKRVWHLKCLPYKGIIHPVFKKGAADAYSTEDMFQRRGGISVDWSHIDWAVKNKLFGSYETIKDLFQIKDQGNDKYGLLEMNETKPGVKIYQTIKQFYGKNKLRNNKVWKIISEFDNKAMQQGVNSFIYKNPKGQMVFLPMVNPLNTHDNGMNLWSTTKMDLRQRRQTSDCTGRKNPIVLESGAPIVQKKKPGRKKKHNKPKVIATTGFKKQRGNPKATTNNNSTTNVRPRNNRTRNNNRPRIVTLAELRRAAAAKKKGDTGGGGRKRTRKKHKRRRRRTRKKRKRRRRKTRK